MTFVDPAGPLRLDPLDHCLAHALGCPLDQGGLALAVRHASRCLAAAASTLPGLPALAAWHEAAVAMAGRLKAHSAGRPMLLTTSAPMLALPGYGAWLSPARADSSDPRVQRLLAAQGHALAAFACSGNTVPPALVGGISLALKSLSGATRQQVWAEIAQGFPNTADEVHAWLKKAARPAIQRMLVALQQAWSIPLVPPEALAAPRAAPPTGVAGANEQVHEDDDDDASDDAIQHDDGARPSSLLGWLVQRANFCGMRAHFGASGRWDALTPAELGHVCKAIRQALVSESSSARFALLAVVSLCTSLPARLAITLPLRPNADLWLAEDFGHLHWSLRRLLDGAQASAPSGEPPRPEQVVDIALPQVAARVGASLRAADPSASSLGALLCGAPDAAAQRAFVEDYRDWLRSQGPGWVHGVYDARFALSLSQIHRANHGDVVAAWLALDFREVALGTLHYVGLPRAMLHQCASQAYAQLGLGCAADGAAPSPASRVGSPVALDADAFAAAWRRLQQACAACRATLATCPALSIAAQTITDLTVARLAAVVIAMAGRGNLLPRLSWPSLYAHAEVVTLVDKRMDHYSDLRGLPVHALLREQLDAHVEDLRLFAATCRRLGAAPTDRHGRDLSWPQAQGAAFYGLQLQADGAAASFRRTIISTEAIDAVARQHFGQPVNVGRHTLVSWAVMQGWDPWLAKVLTGHHRGHAEPFADGGVASPSFALDQLRDVLDGAFGHLVQDTAAPAGSRVLLELPQLKLQPAPLPSAQARVPGSKARLLAPAWQPHTLAELRLCEHLRWRLANGDGPSHAGAEALLVGLQVDAMALDDLRLIWSDGHALCAVNDRRAVVLWRRAPGGQEQQHLVSPCWAIALRRALDGKARLPHWADACEQAARWLRMAVPGTNWPGDELHCLRLLERLAQAWLRFVVPPFLLSAANPRLGAAVPNRLALERLASGPAAEVDARDVLLLSAPVARTSARAPLRESPLTQVLKLVHRYGRTDLHLGEDDQRWHDLAQAVMELDCSADARARAVVQVVQLDHMRWREGSADRIQVSSLSTYLYRIGPDLDRITPNEDVPNWQEEWIDWFQSIDRSTVSRDPDKRDALHEERLVAVRHLLRALSRRQYPVPAELLVPDGRAAPVSVRRPASATVLLQEDQQRIRGLLKRHFADTPLLVELAQLYCSLVFAASLRGAEVGALPLDALTPFNDLAIESGGFSHLKSDHARRLQHLPDDAADAFRAAADLVRAAEPGAAWMFLLDDPNNWATASLIARAFGTALRQVSGDADARQHATRPVAPLAQLLPDWENVLRPLARGQAGTQQCCAFLAQVQAQGVGRLVQVLHAAGHGHPLTFLAHYFSVWPWVLAALVHGSHAGLGDAAALVRNRMPQARAAFRQAKARAIKAGEAFDGWQWAGAHAVAAMKLSALRAERTTPSQAMAPLVESPDAAQNGHAPMQYLAGRYMGLPAPAAAHAFGLTNSMAAKLEASFDERAAALLRRRHQGSADGRGRAADLRLLRGEEGAALAARMTSLAVADLRRLAEFLSTERTGLKPRMPINELIGELRLCATALPQRYGLYVQTGAGRYDAEDLARLRAASAQLHVGPPDRDLGNRPRVSVVQAEAPNNRVQRARLTSLARCLVHAALLVRNH